MPGRDGKWHPVGSASPSQTAVPIAARYAEPTGSGWYVPPPGSSPQRTSTPNGWGTTPQATSNGSADASTPRPLTIPPFFGEALFTPLAGAPSPQVAFSEWESYRTDVAGKNILVTTDDSNFFRDRIGKINANTGDTDASGLNITDATDSVIRGTTSADEAPWQVDPPDDDEDETGDEDEAEEPDDAPDEDVDDAPDENPGAGDTSMTMSTLLMSPSADVAAAVVAPSGCDPDGDDCPDDGSSPEEWDFPYLEWVANANRNTGTAIHTDEGTTLASGADVLVIGADGYDDDDNRAAGENIIITRDDGNVVVGGTGDVNAQIGDSEQGAVIMDVERVVIQGGGAY